MYVNYLVVGERDMDDLARSIKEALNVATPRGGLQAAFNRNQTTTYTTYNDEGEKVLVQVPDRNFRAVAPMLQKQLGVQGIAQSYAFPRGASAADLHDFARLMMVMIRSEPPSPTAGDQLSGVWQGMKARNPDTLGRLSFDEKNPTLVYQALRGTAAGLLPRDIQFAVDHTGKGKSIYDAAVSRLPVYKIMYQSALDAAKVAGFGFYPSPETLGVIQHQMMRKTAPSSAPSTSMPGR